MKSDVATPPGRFHACRLRRCGRAACVGSTVPCVRCLLSYPLLSVSSLLRVVWPSGVLSLLAPFLVACRGILPMSTMTMIITCGDKDHPTKVCSIAPFERCYASRNALPAPSLFVFLLLLSAPLVLGYRAALSASARCSARRQSHVALR